MAATESLTSIWEKEEAVVHATQFREPLPQKERNLLLVVLNAFVSVARLGLTPYLSAFAIQRASSWLLRDAKLAQACPRLQKKIPILPTNVFVRMDTYGIL